MASNARKAFDANLKDIERLLELHSQEGGDQPGRRFGLEVLNKSAIVLITAYWEAYCEDIAAEGLSHIVKYAKSADALPTELKKQLAKEIKKVEHDLEMWKLADKSWKKYLSDRLANLQEERNRHLNTPQSKHIDELFLEAIGIKKISDSWKGKTKMTAQAAQKKLDKFVDLRCSIAHRGQSSKSVQRTEVEDYYEFVKSLAAKTGGAVNKHVKSVTGKPLWRRKSDY